MNVTIAVSKAAGKITVPPSKSYAHRALISAALSGAECSIEPISDSQDMLATIDCIKELGVAIEKDGEKVSIREEKPDTSVVHEFLCRESGSTLRFMIPIALAFYNKAIFRGTERLIERGISVYEEIFAKKGISITKSQDSIVFDGALKAGEYMLRGDVSSQFVTGLLFALPLLDGDSKIELIPPVESRLYIDITVDVLEKFGIKVIKDGNTFTIPGNQKFEKRDYVVEGDWSNGAFLYGLNALGHNVDVCGLKEESYQSDKAILPMIEALKRENAQLDIKDCPDLGPVLFAIAAYLNGARFTGTRRLRIKESDRAAAMAMELKKMGCELVVLDNEVIVPKMSLHAPCDEIDGHNDHRIVMAMAILLTQFGGKINGAEAVAKSYPDFFERIAELGIEVGKE